MAASSNCAAPRWRINTSLGPIILRTFSARIKMRACRFRRRACPAWGVRTEGRQASAQLALDLPNPGSLKSEEVGLRQVKTMAIPAHGAQEGVDVGMGGAAFATVPVDGVHALDLSSYRRAPQGLGEGVAELALRFRPGQAGQVRGRSVVHGKDPLVKDGSAESLCIFLDEPLMGPFAVEGVGDHPGHLLVALADPVDLTALAPREPLLPVGDVLDVPPGPGWTPVVEAADDVHQAPSSSLGFPCSQSSSAGGPSGTARSRRLWTLPSHSATALPQM